MTACFEDPRTRNLMLLGILALCLISRCGWLLYLERSGPEVFLAADSPVYLSAGRALLSDGRFVFEPGSDFPQYNRTPGYPVFIALVFFLFGESLIALLVGQVVLGTATVYLAYRLGSRMWTARTGLAAALVVTLEPLQFTYAGIVLAETLFTFLVISIALVGYSTFSSVSPSPWRALLLGSLVAAATLVRPISYYLPVVVLLFMLLGARGSRRLRARVVGGIAFLAPVLLGYGAWQTRNCAQVGDCRIAGIEAVNLYLYRGAATLAHDEDRPLEDVRRELIDRIPEIRGESLYRIVNGFPIMSVDAVGPVYREMRARGIRILLDDPDDAAWVSFLGLARELLGVGGKSVFPYLGLRDPPLGLLLLAGLALLGFYAFAILGIADSMTAGGHRIAHLFLLAVVVYILVVAAGPEAESRFRTPVMPILSLYAASGVLRFARWLRPIGAPPRRT